MSPEQVEVSVKEVVCRCLHVAPEKLTPTTTWTDLNADSLARIEVTLALEDTFRVRIPDEEAAKFKTLADVVQYLSRHAEAPPPAPTAAAGTP